MVERNGSGSEVPPLCSGSGRLTAQLCQKIGRVDRFGKDFELVTLRAGLFKQIRGSRLAGEEKDFALW
jgi:hypothetical protein